jgi:hypothetical protein
MASSSEKSLAVGHIPGFQIDPKIGSGKDFGFSRIPVSTETSHGKF